MSFSPEYVRIYDILHGQKDYGEESDKLRELFSKYQLEAGTILDYGCGTGNHAKLLASWCKKVIGVDPNDAMLELARKKNEGISNIEFFHTRDLNQIALKSVHACGALFDVLSYMNKNEEIEEFMSFVAKTLAPKGLFVFDFWYGPAVLHLRPINREKVFEIGKEKIVKKIRPVLDEDNNCVKVAHEIAILDPRGNANRQFSDVHSMRYFFDEEIGAFLDRFGFTLKAFGTWKNLNSKPTQEDWSALVIAQLQS